MDHFKVIIVEDVPLELKGTLGIVRSDIPEAEVIGTADTEPAYWRLLKQQVPDLVLLDLGLGGSTTVGVEICRHTKELHPQVKVLIFTGEILNEKLWVDVLDAGADGIILKTGELLTRRDVSAVMDGKQLVFNEPILEKIVERFKASVSGKIVKQQCEAGCIGCRLCTRQCETGSISVENNVAHIDYETCTHCGKCAAKCPAKVIVNRTGKVEIA